MLSSVLTTTKKGRRLLDGYSAAASEKENGGLLWNRDISPSISSYVVETSRYTVTYFK